MLRNYLITALRNLKRHAGHTAINVLGLAVGLAACLLIGRYVADEWRRDRFHANADRIVRVSSKIDQTSGDKVHLSTAPAPLVPTLKAEVPFVENAVRLTDANYLLRHETTQIQVESLFYADPSFFDVFSFELVRGDPATALNAPHTIVLTESLAARLFGTEAPTGQTLTAGDGQALTVTGIVADPPSTSHLQFEALVSMATRQAANAKSFGNWAEVTFWTYVLLAPEAATDTFETQLDEVVTRHAAERFAAYNATLDFTVTPLLDVYLHEAGMNPIGPTGDPAALRVMLLIALFILLIAGINFVNLATARSVGRAREVGVRKTLGAARGALVGQFLAEAVLTALLALGLALVLARTALPLFHTLAGTTLAGGLVPSASVTVTLMVAAIGVGLLAGSYPALVLAGHEPARVLRGSSNTSPEGQTLRKGLIVGQFSIAIALIAGAGIVHQQLRFVQSRDLGFAAEQLVVLDYDSDVRINRQRSTVKREMVELPGVEAAAASRHVPGNELEVTPLSVETPDGSTLRTKAYRYVVDFDFFATYDIDLVAGRTFSAIFARDSTEAIILNEAATAHFGYTDPADAVGAHVSLDVGKDAPRYMIVGVVENFHYGSLRERIEPLIALPPDAPNASSPRFLTLRVQTEHLAETIAVVEDQWVAMAPHRPFEARFFDDAFARFYEQDRRVRGLVGVFAGLAIFTACLGLFGLATLTVQQRTKEIGIRKALGATAASLTALLSRDFAKLVGVAFAVAVPIAYLGMSRWLEGFAYRIDLGAGVFVAAGALALVVALGTVGVQAWRAARLDPTKALRSE